MIELTRLLRAPALVRHNPLRPEVITHRHRPGFIERQDGSWITLPVQTRSARSARSHKTGKANRPKARRRLWHWLNSLITQGATA
ncbi:hypothetical protein [Oceanisphaera arctica]|uniref:Uncharacterized protein n=1 Tax=Oceanisphaera arctica TaxID=641510 RepID=A0A2P5TK47_9GAMM|nr:hypothetical protein [Oceanisphaera arctica]PPL15467.1 hypothetical protein UN63_12370 [Oceanisphaera arctica]GHA05442.1 hypothetical protein GCM10007082_02950 [Oceanisphaera arctica]